MSHQAKGICYISGSLFVAKDVVTSDVCVKRLTSGSLVIVHVLVCTDLSVLSPELLHAL